MAGLTAERSEEMRIVVTSVFVDDQEKALRFYTEVLGFSTKSDIPLGEARWLTVVSPEDPGGTELLLEPDGHPAVGPFKRALVEDGIPYASLGVGGRALHSGAAGDGLGDRGGLRRHVR
jgi:catechol 2,3-dioxygenase-like lactoylglutathione lyase family enzyme